MVEIDGHSMRALTVGLDARQPGHPVVVFESGAGTPLENWASVLPGVTEFAPAVAYDRLGIGQSARDDERPTPQRRAAQLHALLTTLEVPPPYVLVGHSWGGPLIRFFAGAYPDEVVGMVYVDPTDAELTQDDWVAVFESIGGGVAQYDEFIAVQKQFYAQAPPGIQDEMDVVFAFLESDLASRAVPPSPNVPIAVLLAAKYEPPPPGIALSFDYKSYDAAWDRQRIQRFSEWVLEAPEATLALATHAGHHIHDDDAALVVEAIRRVSFPSIAPQLVKAVDGGGAAALAETYHTLQSYYPTERFDEDLLNTLGYALLREGRVDDAIATFELNADEYSGAANPHDSLGDAYSAAGRLDEAMESYGRAVELGEEQGHPSLSVFQANFERVSQQLEEE
jgi:pimeloyl-ACP methyl ester carboxylesterase